MSVRITRSLIDDIDGSQAEATATFSLMGNHYEVDLSTDNGAALVDALAPYVKVARKVSKRDAGISPSKRAGYIAPGAVANDSVAIRAWATDKGIKVGAKGRIPASVRERYAAEQGEQG